MSTATQHLRSLGTLAGDLRVSYPRLVRVIADLQIEPALILNETQYFDQAAIERVMFALGIVVKQPDAEHAHRATH